MLEIKEEDEDEEEDSDDDDDEEEEEDDEEEEEEQGKQQQEEEQQGGGTGHVTAAAATGIDVFRPAKHSQGVTGPSQIRFVGYFARTLLAPTYPSLPRAPRVLLLKMRVWRMPACTPYCVLRAPGKYVLQPGGRRPTLVHGPNEKKGERAARERRPTYTRRLSGNGSASLAAAASAAASAAAAGASEATSSAPTNGSLAAVESRASLSLSRGSSSSSNSNNAHGGGAGGSEGATAGDEKEEEEEEWVELEIVGSNGQAPLAEGEFKLEVKSKTKFGQDPTVFFIYLDTRYLDPVPESASFTVVHGAAGAGAGADFSIHIYFWQILSYSHFFFRCGQASL